MIIEPRPMSYEEFPESNAAAEGMKTIQMDKTALFCNVIYRQEYCYRDGMPLHMHILLPSQHEQPDTIWPLIVYVQGSAWMKQDLDINLLSLSWFAKKGYAVAIVEYRPSQVAPFPAQVQDTKTAIRFLRKHAERYKLDAEEIIVWGDSSGGHTAVMTGITEQYPDLDSDVYSGYSCKVKGIIDFYGPTDISQMNNVPSTMDHILPESPEGMLIGGFNVLQNPQRVAPTICMNYVSEDTSIPPVLIFHGNKDRLVPFEQSILLYKDMKSKGKEVEMYRLKGADHGGAAFWTEEILNIIDEFTRKCFSKV